MNNSGNLKLHVNSKRSIRSFQINNLIESKPGSPYSSYGSSTNIVNLKFNQSLGNEIEINVFSIQGKVVLNTTKQLQNNSSQLDISFLKLLKFKSLIHKENLYIFLLSSL